MANKQILSPLPGTFYRKPAPDKPPYKSEGDTVATGDTIGLDRGDEVVHEVAAERRRQDRAFPIDNEEPIMAGQPIAEIDD